MKSNIVPIEDNKKTIAAIVRERIRAAILSGELAAGSRLDQAQLAADLEVSLVPVREALKALDAEGFVKIIPRRGAFVAHTSTKDIDDLYFTREILEGQAAYYAAPRLTDQDIKTLEGLLKDMDNELEGHSHNLFMQSNREFHFTIYNALGNDYLINMITSVWDLGERYRYQYLFLRDQGAIIQKEHQTIFEACRARDAHRLEKAIVSHMQRTLGAVKEYFQAQHQHPEEQR
ncbi:MAG TPA: GntR family transcriptional regulator [Aggregatilineales bacterium]|nr:GntR family transcriptional regulator [Aggregatilineales bacterium]